MKQRRKKCKICGEKFIPLAAFQKWCNPECGLELAMQIRKKINADKEKKERAVARARKLELKTRSDWIKEAQNTFNRYIIARDADKPCICCGRTRTDVAGLRSHGWDAGHYRSIGSAPHLRFNEDNVHKQLVYCNRWRSGNAVDYRIGLEARIGPARLLALESNNVPAKWSIDELRAIKGEYNRKFKHLIEQEL